MKKLLSISMFILLLTFAVACNTSDEESSNSDNSDGEWEPDGGITFMASYAPGGGHDTMLRTMSSVLSNEGIIDNSINVINKPGGSAAVGLGHAASQEGADDYIFSVTSSYLTTPLQGNVDHSFEDFTPIARLGEDPYIVLVNSESGISNFKEFEEFIKEGNATFGGTSTGGGSHLLALQIEEAFGANIEYVPFEGDGEVVTALLGGHIDVIADNIHASKEYIENGDMIPIAVSTQERLEEYPEVPTLIESGYDIEWTLFRGIYGPPNMPEEARAWYEEKMKELSENEKWQSEYLDKYSIKQGFMNGSEFESYLTELNSTYEEHLRTLGIIE
ncbi:hypothetical protein TMU01_27940 [Tenuibacillus multivorans]|uniref:Putative tricarboxylic transport membrane protein n=2 Tax=Tenuibacillus multivorans TaxID=237069 RepID=A0A1H0BXU7_9BACI|nr:hypothetical protein TMU01_27940 [Tenuibacillus multivorans]SDN50300.1 putative tricarboxylic transport membrane protein [Tenuibacillus multivorans]